MRNYFRLWFAIRRTATVEHIASEEKLGMEADESFPLRGKIPLPPVLIQQLDMILMLIMDTKGAKKSKETKEPGGDFERKFLEDFQTLASAKNPKSWMTLYLITFMSLHCCACLSEESHNNARKHGLLVRTGIILRVASYRPSLLPSAGWLTWTP